MLYTGHNLVENYKQFKSYPALQVNKFDRNTTTFPKLRICSHSQHSAYKVAAYYPSIGPNFMQKFYGFASSRTEKDLWNKLVITKLINKMPINWPGTKGINMTRFFHLTELLYLALSI